MYMIEIDFLQIQIVLRVVLLVAMADAFIGSFLYRGCNNDTENVALEGFTGYSGEYNTCACTMCTYM